MSPTILVVGATGNTGVGVLQHLASALPSNKHFSSYRIIGLTRDTKSAKSKELAKLPNVEMLEKDWTSIDSDWLTAHQVQRIFIAPHNMASHFTDESLFLEYALMAGVEYLVRISTTHMNVGPLARVFYGRNHWAIETLLGTPEFSDLKWTSLQPNVFTSMFIQQPIDWIGTYKGTGEKKKFSCLYDEHVKQAIVDPVEVGIIAGHLLALPSEEISAHSHKKYVVAGATDASCRDVIDLVEKYAGTTVDDIVFKDSSFAEGLRQAGYPDNVIPTFKRMFDDGNRGGASIEDLPTSKELRTLYEPKNGLLNLMEEQLKKL